MANIFVVNTGGLKETIDSLQRLFEQNGDVFATGLGFDGPVVGKVFDVDVPEVTPYDEVNDDSFDNHEIVQVRVDDLIDDEGNSNEQWVDTTYHPDEIDQVRYDFPDHEYRVVMVTDEIYTEFVGVTEEQNEIESLKTRVIELEAQLANERNVKSYVINSVPQR